MNARRKKTFLDALLKYEYSMDYVDYERIIDLAGISWDEYTKARDQYEDEFFGKTQEARRAPNER